MANFSSDSCLTMLSVGISRAIGIWTLKTWTLKLQKKKMMMKITKTMVPVVKTTRGGGDHERPTFGLPNDYSDDDYDAYGPGDVAWALALMYIDKRHHTFSSIAGGYRDYRQRCSTIHT